MPISITCPDCQTSMNVRDELAGKTLKCPGCDRELTAEAQPTPEAPTPVRPVAVRSDRDEPRRRRDDDYDDRPRSRRRDDDYDDDDDRPRRRRDGRRAKKPAGVPPVVLAVGAGVFLLIVATVVVVYFATRDTSTAGNQKSGGQGMARWERQTLPGSPLSVEMPEQAHRQRALQQNPFGAETDTGLFHMSGTDSGPMSMSVAQLTGQIMKGPGAGGDMLDMIAEAVKRSPNMRITDRSPVQGRKSLTVTSRDEDGAAVLRFIQDGSKTYVLECSGVGITETTAEVRRFIDSPQFVN